jgi:signal transduction histidine kinase
VLAAVLLLLSVLELLFSDEQPPVDAVRFLMAVVPPVMVAFSRSAPHPAAIAVVAVHLLAALDPGPSGTFGAGLSFMVVVFGVAAWSRAPWPYVTALAVASAVHDARTTNTDLTDLLIDWVFIALAVSTGRIVHRRTAHAAALTSRLQLADHERETSAQDAVTRERGVIARELHDIVAHSVSLMVVQAGTARPAAERVDRELAAVLEAIEQTGREALTELRRLLGVLRTDDALDHEPVPDLGRLDALVRSFQAAGVDVRARIETLRDVPPGVALCAYRAVQEGLTNSLRHAPGSPVHVEVWEETGKLSVRVRDGGGPASTDALGAGTGLIGLRERVLLCGGRLHAGPDGTGYLLDVTLPLDGQVPRVPGGPS